MALSPVLQDYGGRFEPLDFASNDKLTETVQRQAEMNQRAEERKAERKDAQAKQDELDQQKKNEYLQTETNPNDPNKVTASEKANTMLAKRLEATRKKFSGDEYGKGKMSVSQFQSEVQKDMATYMEGYTPYKQKLIQQESDAKTIVPKVDPNIDMTLFLKDLRDQIDADSLLTDEKTGETTFNKANTGISKDYITEMLKPENRHKYINTTDNYDKMTSQDAGGVQKREERLPNGGIRNYEINVPFWAEETRQPNKNGYIDGEPSVRVKGESHLTFKGVDKDGKPIYDIQVLAPKETEEKLLNTPQMQAEFQKKWEDEKKNKKLKFTESQQDEERIARRAFMYSDLEKKLNKPARDTGLTAPPRPTGGGGGGSKAAEDNEGLFRLLEGKFEKSKNDPLKEVGLNPRERNMLAEPVTGDEKAIPPDIVTYDETTGEVQAKWYKRNNLNGVVTIVAGNKVDKVRKYSKEDAMVTIAGGVRAANSKQKKTVIDKTAPKTPAELAREAAEAAKKKNKK